MIMNSEWFPANMISLLHNHEESYENTIATEVKYTKDMGLSVIWKAHMEMSAFKFIFFADTFSQIHTQNLHFTIIIFSDA